MFWVIVWVAHSIFVRESSDLSLVFMDPSSIHHPIYFGCDYFPCFDAGWPSLIFLSLRLLLSLFYSSVSPNLIWSHYFLILLYVWLGIGTHTSYLFIQCDHSFIITIRVGTPKSETHDVFYALHLMHEGYGDYIIGIFEPSFLSFLSPYYPSLHYVPCLKTTLRPLLHIVFDSSHMGNTRAWSEIISWSMMDRELRWWFTLGHTPLISDGFSEVPLSILGHIPLIDDVFFQDDALHWGIVNSLIHLDYDGLGVVGWPYTRA